MIDARQIKAEEQQYFDKHIDAYVARFCEGRWLAYKRYVSTQVVRRLPRRGRGLSVLDVGCGPMPAMETLADRASRYVCLDLSERNLRHLTAHFPHCRVVRSDAEALPFASQSFDVIVSFGLLHHLPDPQRGAAEIRRVLRPGGLVVASEPSTHWKGQMASPHERGTGESELLASPHERGLGASELLAMFNGVEASLYTFGHPFLEGPAARAARWFPRLGGATSPLWRVLFAGERVFAGIGISGWDLLLVGRAPQ